MLLFASVLLSTSFVLQPFDVPVPSAARAPFDARAALESPNRHVRSQDRSVRQLLKRGFTYSPTFRNLMARIEKSDVIVYVEEVPRLPSDLEGRMMILPNAHGTRYVRIQLAMRGSPDDAVAVLGHELQHALEVADEPWVSDQATMAALYQRIGIGSLPGHHVYDTRAAQEIGRIVRRELLA
jgi:hypothetical protein